jgi:hypothetical protein
MFPWGVPTFHLESARAGNFALSAELLRAVEPGNRMPPRIFC